MTILRDLSAAWCMLHTLIIFVFLFESRFTRKTTAIITIATMTPLCILNFVGFLMLGAEEYGQILIFTCTLPSLIVFWILAKHRDGRFLFTFCLADTISLEILCLSNILDFYFAGESFILMFVLRIIAYPLIEWLFYKKIRTVYLDVQTHSKKGWYVFAAISAIFYVSITLMMSYPTLITQRPEYLPSFLLLLLLMPLLYFHILSTLRHQQKMHQIAQEENILRLQAANMRSRIEEYSIADERFRVERHNFRHKMQTIAALADSGRYSELKELVEQYSEAIEETRVTRYCSNAVIDAVLSSYLQQAARKGIQVNAAIQLPDELPVSEAELAAVFANAIENAINACEKLEIQDRRMDVQSLTAPRFMIQISNSFDGNVEFGDDCIPISHKPGHGLGTRSIAAFCEKHGAYYEFKAEDKKFSLRIVFA